MCFKPLLSFLCRQRYFNKKEKKEKKKKRKIFDMRVNYVCIDQHSLWFGHKCAFFVTYLLFNFLRLYYVIISWIIR